MYADDEGAEDQDERDVDGNRGPGAEMSVGQYHAEVQGRCQ